MADSDFRKQSNKYASGTRNGFVWKVQAGVDTMSQLKPWEVFDGENFVREIAPDEPAPENSLTMTFVQSAGSKADCASRLVFDYETAVKFYDAHPELCSLDTMSEEEKAAFLREHGQASRKNLVISAVSRTLHYWKRFATGLEAWLVINVEVMEKSGKPCPDCSWTVRTIPAGEAFDAQWEEALDEVLEEIDAKIKEN